MEARGLAATGDERSSVHLLDRALRLLDTPTDEVPPIWLSPFDEASFTTEAVLCMRALAHHDQAVTLATRGLALRATGRARSTALASILLIDAHIRGGNLDAACEAAQTLIQSPQPVASMRIVSQLAELHHQLKHHRKAPAVRHILESLRSFREQLLIFLAAPTPALQDPSP
jgi:hypothetical protein